MCVALPATQDCARQNYVEQKLCSARSYQGTRLMGGEGAFNSAGL